MIGFRNSIPRNTRKWHYDDSEEEAEEEAAAEALAEAKAEHAEMVLAKRKEVTNAVTVRVGSVCQSRAATIAVFLHPLLLLLFLSFS